MATLDPKHSILATLGGREAAFAADPDIAARHGAEKRQARLRIHAKITEYWDEYRAIPLLQKPAHIDKGKLTDQGARAVREKVVQLLREAPLNHGFNAGGVFSNGWDIGTSMKNCWHLNLGGTTRERTEEHLFRYGGAAATPRMKTYSSGGEASATFLPNTRPFYASLNYSRARYGGSSGWGKTHLVLRHVLRFNATFTYADSFAIESEHKAEGYKLLANYHNVYPLINKVAAGGKDGDGHDRYDVLKSIIDFALGRKTAPAEEFDGRHYIEAQIPGDILFARDVERIVVANSEYAPASPVGKSLKKFAKHHGIRIDFI